MNNKGFNIVLFAGDINVYSMARAFHEAYGIKPKAYGKFPTGPCYLSEIMDYDAVGDVDTQEGFMRTLGEFSRQHEDEKILVVGCGDSYVRLISANKKNLPDNVIAPYIDVDLMDELINKERFYELCDRVGLDHPATFVYRKEMGKDFELPFSAPYIIKPSSGIKYWEHPFETQKKVYCVNTREELESVIDDIYGAGYPDSLIIQDFVPGDDSFMRVLTCYSDRNAKVKLMCLGHVLLEEHTPHGIGNHAVIITEYQEALCAKFKALLEELNYVGFSNFDIKYDSRDDKFKVFEINTRQGRSNYYVTGAGANLAEYLVTDYIDRMDIPERIVRNESLWMVVPEAVAFSYVHGRGYHEKMKRLISEGKCVNPLIYPEDKGFKHRLAIRKNLLSHFYKFRKYCK